MWRIAGLRLYYLWVFQIIVLDFLYYQYCQEYEITISKTETRELQIDVQVPLFRHFLTESIIVCLGCRIQPTALAGKSS